MPTILDFIGVDPPEHLQGQSRGVRPSNHDVPSGMTAAYQLGHESHASPIRRKAGHAEDIRRRAGNG
jgi:arylsulfatase A-like enzyme